MYTNILILFLINENSFAN